MSPYQQNDDGSWTPAQPIGWREEHGWVARLVFWLRGVPHCDKPGRHRDVVADRLAEAEATIERVRALLAPYPCHQCGSTGEQVRGERLLADAAAPGERCQLCDGRGSIEPFAVQSEDLRVILDSEPTP